jgi:acyl-homoserine-lactone acylase
VALPVVYTLVVVVVVVAAVPARLLPANPSFPNSPTSDRSQRRNSMWHRWVCRPAARRTRAYNGGARFARAGLVRLVAVAAVSTATPAAALIPASATVTPWASTGGGQGAVIRRTAHGIPHILASGFRGLGLGAGYAFAEDNLCLLADSVVTLSGERSRWFGPDASTSGRSNLDSDFFHRQVNQARIVEDLLARPVSLGPSTDARELVRGYAAGYNRYLAERGVANLPDPICRGAGWIRPITELDLWRRVYDATGFAGSGQFVPEIAAAQPPGAQPVAPARRPFPGRADDAASNAYALGSTVTTGHTGMLLANPHSRWQGDARLYQQHLTIPGVLNASGAGPAGIMALINGHNDRVAWTHTSSTAWTFTLTRLSLATANPTSYVVDGQVKPMTRLDVTVPVRRADGGIATVKRTMYRTPHGPLVEIPGFLDWSATTAYVLHDANAGNLRAVDQWLAIARARNVAQLHAALLRHQGVPALNTVAADADGAAYYSDIQVVPHVTDALTTRCATGPEFEVVVLDGGRSACEWGTDPDAVEPGLLGPGRLPTLTRRDFVSNSNDSPWLANPDAPLTGYPQIVGDVATARSLRTRLALDMLARRRDGTDGLGPAGFTLPTLQATMLANRNHGAELGRDAVVAMCRANPTLPASDGRPVDVRTGCAALARWDLHANSDSRGAVLWRQFFEQAQDTTEQLWRVPFDPAHPLTTPRGLDADQPSVRSALADTVRQFRTNHIPPNLPLGTAQRYRSIPIHGCTQEEGCFNAIEPDGTLRPDGTYTDVDSGATFIMAVELTPTGPRTRTILTYGQSANPTSPFHTDQTRLYAAKQWVTERFTEHEIATDPTLTTHRI